MEARNIRGLEERTWPTAKTSTATMGGAQLESRHDSYSGAPITELQHLNEINDDDAAAVEF